MNNTTCKRRVQKREIIWKQGAKEDLISWEPPSAQRRIHKIFWFISYNEQYANTQNTNTNKNTNTQNFGGCMWEEKTQRIAKMSNNIFCWTDTPINLFRFTKGRTFKF